MLSLQRERVRNVHVGALEHRVHVALSLAPRCLLRGRIHSEVHLEVAAAIRSQAAAVGDQLIDGGKQGGLLVRGDRSQ